MTGRFRVFRRLTARLVLLAAVLCSSYKLSNSWAVAQVPAAPARPAATTEFPAELVEWKPRPGNPVFTGAGPGHWDAKIRERGWILRDGVGNYRLWYTGYDGTHEGIKLLGYAMSTDGLHWARLPKNPLRDRWIEDMMIVESGDIYYMFAEGKDDNHAQMLTSKDGVAWNWEGPLDIRAADGKSPAKKPCGTPTVWIENNVWYLLYEWNDKGVWLAKAKDPRPRVWTNVQNDPVISPGPGEYDKDMIAVNQVIKHRGAYFAFYHGSGSGTKDPRTWNTNIARSIDLVHWKKYPGNPIVDDNKSSGVVVPVGSGFRLYTMHDQIDVFESVAK